MTTTESPKLLSIPELAELAGLTRVRIWQLVDLELLPAIKVNEHCWGIQFEDAQKFLSRKGIEIEWKE